jgi:hypothetical protein
MRCRRIAKPNLRGLYELVAYCAGVKRVDVIEVGPLAILLNRIDPRSGCRRNGNPAKR